ncbi:DEAD/DEAH box helicase [Longimicrobium sp.]|jgi:type III restriction enzyme|uniref:DEAD/DEAH box helicase n=1 Tax=Longimicrobium sp. TaxID=2029185 RepID=UPI002ED7D753
MSRHVANIASRLSLRAPQREALQILDDVTGRIELKKDMDLQSALQAVAAAYPSLTDFEREFPSLCFALATGVGKTRLMGAFISYLHLAHGKDNFFVLAPNLTVYNKLIADFTPNTPKYVFRGIAEFATSPPELITGDTYENRSATLFDETIRCRVNIFNIAKITSEVRGGRSPRIKRLSEYIGESYFAYLAALPDLVLLMDESHRYRASAGVRAINELRPVLGLELTATPYVETGKGPVPFRNVVQNYPLGRAMADGFVKEPAVVTRRNFDARAMAPEQLERIKLEDGIRLHESVKVDLETYARQTGREIVKPFLLVIARDTTHAGDLLRLIESDTFLEGRYRGRVIQVDSSQTGAAEEQMVERLLRVEHADEPTEIVIHVNMLKEGWDVTNLYTIVPLRAANARILIEQSIGRGLRLPYGGRTGQESLDRLSIVAHDRFQEIVDEASRPDSIIQLKKYYLGEDGEVERGRTVVSQSTLASQLGLAPAQATPSTEVAAAPEAPAFATPQELQVAQIAWRAIRGMGNQPALLPSTDHLRDPEVRARIQAAVTEAYQPAQLEMDGVAAPVDVAAIVARTAELVADRTISIPRILVLPTAERRTGFRPFMLDLRRLNLQVPDETLHIQEMRTGQVHTLDAGTDAPGEERLENYIVRELIDQDDISYDENADLLYDLAGQVVAHLGATRTRNDVEKIVRGHARRIAEAVHAQMQDHYWEEDVEYETRVTAGMTELKESAFKAHDATQDFRVAPRDRANMAKYLFGGFARCLYPVQKFDSETERQMAVILDRESLKWFRPARGQFQLFYKRGHEQAEYQPDFVAETDDAILMVETKAESELNDAEVLAKRDVAVLWCGRASEYTATYAGKPWRYLLVPHGAVTQNIQLSWLDRQYAQVTAPTGHRGNEVAAPADAGAPGR